MSLSSFFFTVKWFYLFLSNTNTQFIKQFYFKQFSLT